MSLSLNTFQLLINEIGLNLDYCYNYRHSMGINVAIVYPSYTSGVNIFASDQAGDWPGCVYNGMAYRLNYKYYFNHSRRLYFSPQLLFKSLSYEYHSFINSYNGNGHYVAIDRSENATIFGFDLYFGYHIKTPQSLLNMETFIGLGYRHRIRDYTTFGTHFPNTNAYITDTTHPIGSFQQVQDYPILIVGFKIGINAFFK